MKGQGRRFSKSILSQFIVELAFGVYADVEQFQLIRRPSHLSYMPALGKVTVQWAVAAPHWGRAVGSHAILQSSP
jgi:hypothetical protein